MNDKTLNLVIIAAVGLGAYFLVTRRTSPQTENINPRYPMAPSYMETSEQGLAARPRTRTDSYVDLATSALDLWDAWGRRGQGGTQVYVPDFAPSNPVSNNSDYWAVP